MTYDVVWKVHNRIFIQMYLFTNLNIFTSVVCYTIAFIMILIYMLYCRDFISQAHVWKLVLRIHDILVWIRIRMRGSMWLMDPDPDSDPDPNAYPDTAIFIINLQEANKNLFKKKFSCILLFEGTFT